MMQEEVEERLSSMADRGYDAFNSRIARSPKRTIGVRLPDIRSYAKEIVKGDWRSFAALPSQSLDQCILKAVVIATARAGPGERLELTKGFLPEIEEWGTCDCLCASWKIGKEEDASELFSWCEGLLDSGKEFPMRVGAVMMLAKFMDREHIDTVLKDLGKTRKSPGYYWDMGLAWTLSVCFIKFPEKTEEVLFSGTGPREVLKMTLQKIRDSYRVERSEKDRLTQRFKTFPSEGR